MSFVDSILTFWKTNQNIEDLINSGLFSDQDALQKELNSLSEQNHSETLLQFQEIYQALTAYLESLEIEQANVKSQLDQNLKSAKACLSYGSSIDIEKRRHET